MLAADSRVPLYAAAEPALFASGSEINHRLSPADVKSVAPLLARVAGADGAMQYDFLALNAKVLARGGSPNLHAELPRRRFEFIEAFQSAPKHKVLLYRLHDPVKD